MPNLIRRTPRTITFCIVAALALLVGATTAWAAPESAPVSTPPDSGLGVLDWAIIALYAVGLLGIGWHYSRRTRTTEDYLLGGRSMKSGSVGLSRLQCPSGN